MIKLPDTLQEIFDIVSTHLLKQVKRCMAEYPHRTRAVCSYRNAEGMKCAAGALIPDDQYKPEFEQKMWHALVFDKVVENKFYPEICALQKIHDNNIFDEIDYLKERLIIFAKNHKLTHNIEV